MADILLQTSIFTALINTKIGQTKSTYTYISTYYIGYKGTLLLSYTPALDLVNSNKGFAVFWYTVDLVFYKTCKAKRQLFKNS